MDYVSVCVCVCDSTYYPDAHDENNSSERQGLSRVVGPCHRVHKTPDKKEWKSKEGAC